MVATCGPRGHMRMHAHYLRALRTQGLLTAAVQPLPNSHPSPSPSPSSPSPNPVPTCRLRAGVHEILTASVQPTLVATLETCRGLRIRVSYVHVHLRAV